jgi:hypothetical protein
MCFQPFNVCFCKLWFIFLDIQTKVLFYLTQIHFFHLQADSESQMASTDDSDDSSEDGPQYSAIIQPSLIKQLRKILDEYPDGGQILKVCEYSPNLTVKDSAWAVLNLVH